MKRIFLVFCTIMLVVPTFSISVWAAGKLRVATGVKMEPLLTMPVIAAGDKGFWKRNGLDVEWVPMKAGAASFRALAAGAVELVISSTSGMILSASRGVPALGVADLQIKDYGMRIFVRGDSRIKKSNDMKGASVGVTRFGGMAHNYARQAINSLGMEKDVKFMALGGVAETIAGLKAGRVDGVMTTIGSVVPLMVKGEVRAVVSMVDHLPDKWSEISVISYKKFAKDNPDAIRKAVKAVLQSTDFIQRDKAWTEGQLKSFFMFPDQATSWFYKRLNYGKDGLFDVAALKNVRKFLTDYGIVKKGEAIPVKDVYTNQFVR